jgi:hypothetical protein
MGNGGAHRNPDGAITAAEGAHAKSCSGDWSAEGIPMLGR